MYKRKKKKKRATTRQISHVTSFRIDGTNAEPWIRVGVLTFKQLQLHGLTHVQPFQPRRFIDSEEPLQSSEARRTHGWYSAALLHPEAAMRTEVRCGPFTNVVPTAGSRLVSLAGRGSYLIVLRGGNMRWKGNRARY